MNVNLVNISEGIYTNLQYPLTQTTKFNTYIIQHNILLMNGNIECRYFLDSIPKIFLMIKGEGGYGVLRL